MVTMRCTHRRFRLTPNRAVNDLVRYLVAVTASKYQVGVIAMTFQSDHAHLVVTDHMGQLPAMLQEMNALLARNLNQLHRKRGSVFERNNIDIKHLVTHRAVMVALGYLAANPVAACCVEYGADWPGIRTQVRQIGRPGETIRRPAFLFRPAYGEYQGDLPNEATLTLELPPWVRPEERGQFIHEAERAVHEAEEKARADNKAQGRTYWGRARCWNADPNIEATEEEDHGQGTGPDPILATDPESKKAALKELEAFHAAYAEAWHRWKEGDRTVCFPPGTWNMVQRHNARAHPPPAK
ncbi:MAG: transposase [Myxococcales bacterium]|nr:transposase [Myxococcales bacterium]